METFLGSDSGGYLIWFSEWVSRLPGSTQTEPDSWPVDLVFGLDPW